MIKIYKIWHFVDSGTRFYGGSLFGREGEKADSIEEMITIERKKEV